MVDLCSFTVFCIYCSRSLSHSKTKPVDHGCSCCALPLLFMRKSALENILQVDADDRAPAAARPRQREDLCEIADDDGLKRRSCSPTEILKKGQAAIWANSERSGAGRSEEEEKDK